MALNVRTADAYDRDALLAMAKAMHAESPRYQGRSFNEQKLLGVIDYFIEHGGIFVAEQDAVLVGMVAGMMTSLLFTDDRFVSDIATYVKPEARGTSAAIRLINAFEEWAFAQGADEVLLGVSCGNGNERIVDLYQRLGYKLTSFALIKTKEENNV